jgi:BTB/POZ domain
MDALEILIHAEAIASQSPALNKLMRGEMSEGKTGEVTWADVDLATFTRFTQFAYTGDYSVPKNGREWSDSERAGSEGGLDSV